MFSYKHLYSLFVLLLTPGLASAYIGPGVGLSAIGSVISLIVAALLLVVGFLWYPIKRLLRKRKNETVSELASENQEGKEKE